MNTAMKANKKINTAPAIGSTYGILCTTLSTTSIGCSSVWVVADGAWLEWLDMVYLSERMGIFYSKPANR